MRGRIPLRSVWTNSALRAEVTPFSSVSSPPTRLEASAR
jgi:hypothetical protein